MRRLSLILATVVATVVTVDGVQACKLLCHSPRRCCQPLCCLPTVYGPAAAENNQAAEPTGQHPALSVDDAPVVTVPEVPHASQIGDTTTSAETRPEQPAKVPAATAAEAAPADNQAAVKPDSGVRTEEPAGDNKAMTDEQSLDAFFGKDAEKPASADSPPPAKKTEPPTPDRKSPTKDEEKSALDAFFSTQTQKPSPGDLHAGRTGFRTWRDISGRYQLEARFVTCFDDGTVRLVKPNGRWVRLPYTQLSQADQLVVRQTYAASERIAMTAR